MSVPVVTIDGPSGVGKGTISLKVAAETGWHMLDSGSLYRLTALKSQRCGITDMQQVDDSQLVDIAENLSIDYVAADENLRIFLDGDDVGDSIRTEAIGNLASQIATRSAVRQALLQKQRDFAVAPGLVADGRDMGTVVFPQAGLKIFLTASPQERAKRRYNQLIEKGIGANLHALVDELKQRDERDSKRSVAPLVAAEDAAVIDTTSLTIEQVTENVMGLLRNRFF